MRKNEGGGSDESMEGRGVCLEVRGSVLRGGVGG